VLVVGDRGPCNSLQAIVGKPLKTVDVGDSRG
jgi:hypothetical protein